MSINKSLFSSKTDDWETPQVLFDGLNQEFRFDVDVCADWLNTKCREYICKESDALVKDWTVWKARWMNPPYGREIGKWIKKAYESAKQGGLQYVCCLRALILNGSMIIFMAKQK